MTEILHHARDSRPNDLDFDHAYGSYSRIMSDSGPGIKMMIFKSGVIDQWVVNYIF